MSTSKFARGGGQACAVFGCTNNRKKIYSWKKSFSETHKLLFEDCACCKPFSLHKLPSKQDEHRQKWLSNLNRKQLPKDGFVCSVHFVDGRPTETNPYPTLNLGYATPMKAGRPGRRVLRRKQPTPNLVAKQSLGINRAHASDNYPPSVMEDHVSTLCTVNMEMDRTVSTTTSCSTGTQWTDLSLEDHTYTADTVNSPYSMSSGSNPFDVKTYAEKGVNCRSSHITMSFDTITTDTLSNLYTGLNLTAFQTLVNILKISSLPFKFTMHVADQVLLTLMKLKLNLLFADLAHRFGVLESHASNIFNSWLPFMATTLKDLIVWLPRETIRATMPSSFHKKYPHTTVIIDCAETFLQMPRNLKTRGETYSHYKSHNTVKYLVGIAPHGQTMFISKGFGGRASDKFVVENSGFLDFLLPGDEVMADRGFTISNELFLLRIKLNIPAFTYGKKQLSEKDVTETRRIVHVRIHVERAIRRLKVFKMLSDIVPISCAKKIDDILVVWAALVNLGSPLIKDVEEGE